jgi:ATP-dependent DNA helicase RecQ
LTDIGWGNRLRSLFGAQDQEIPDDVFAACVKVLTAWGWAERPVGVVTVGSRTRPALVGSFGQRIAAVGRLPLLGQVWLGESTHRANSAQRLAGLVRGSDVPDLSTVDGPVLLVDDQIDTGWTMTVAARLLRRAGASAVLPFALAVTA